MLYLISIPSRGFSLISLESKRYPFGCPMKAPWTTGAPPLGSGTNVGMIATASVGDAGAAAGVAPASSVSRKAAPAPVGSMPYSAGNTTVASNAPAINNAATAAIAMRFFEGAWNFSNSFSSIIVFSLGDKISGELVSDQQEAAGHQRGIGQECMLKETRASPPVAQGDQHCGQRQH